MKMQDFMQKIKEKKLKRSDWLIFSPGRHIDSDYRIAHRYKKKKQAEEAKKKIFQRKIIPWRHLRMK